VCGKGLVPCCSRTATNGSKHARFKFRAELEAVRPVQSGEQFRIGGPNMLRPALSVLMAFFLAVGAGAVFARGGGGGPGGGFGGPHVGGLGPGAPVPGSAPSLPSHAPLLGFPEGSPPGLPHADSSLSQEGKAHASKHKARGLDRAESRMSPQGAKNANDPRSPNRAHGRARAEERHALLDRSGRR
jgi:hypothetical protein